MAHGHPAVRRRSTGGRASGRSPGRPRSTRPTTTSTTRTRSARPAGRCGPRRRTSGSRPSARSSARSPAGSGRTGSSRTPTTRASAAGPRSRPSGRAAGPASTGARRSRPRRSRRGRPSRSSTRRASRRSRSSGRGAAAFLERLCANEVDVPVGRDRLHLDAELARRDRDRPDRDPRRAGPLPARHRDRVRPARPGLAPEAPAGRRQRAAQRHHVGPRLLRAVGTAAPATSSRRSRPTTSRTRRSRS